MRKPKRKYIHKEAGIVPQGDSGGLVGEGGTIPPPGGDKPPSEFSFEDLPLSLRKQFEFATRVREAHHFPLLLEERKAEMVKNFRGERPR